MTAETILPRVREFVSAIRPSEDVVCVCLTVYASGAFHIGRTWPKRAGEKTALTGARFGSPAENVARRLLDDMK